jgi:integrase
VARLGSCAVAVRAAVLARSYATAARLIRTGALKPLDTVARGVAGTVLAYATWQKKRSEPALLGPLGLRSSELLSFRVRDLDEGGTVLLIGRGKTANARRRPEVPDFLRPHLLTLTANHAPEAFIFGARPSGERRLTGYLIRQVHQVCRRASVPLVCAHSLRGLHATLALRQGVSTQAVATALGHGSFAVTARHYAEPTQLLNTRVRTMLAALRDPTAPAQMPPCPS